MRAIRVRTRIWRRIWDTKWWKALSATRCFDLGAVGVGGEGGDGGGEDTGEGDSVWTYEAVEFYGIVTVVCTVAGGGDTSLFVGGDEVVDDGVLFFYG